MNVVMSMGRERSRVLCLEVEDAMGVVNLPASCGGIKRQERGDVH